MTPLSQNLLGYSLPVSLCNVCVRAYVSMGSEQCLLNQFCAPACVGVGACVHSYVRMCRWRSLFIESLYLQSREGMIVRTAGCVHGYRNHFKPMLTPLYLVLSSLKTKHTHARTHTHTQTHRVISIRSLRLVKLKRNCVGDGWWCWVS